MFFFCSDQVAMSCCCFFRDLILNKVPAKSELSLSWVYVRVSGSQNVEICLFVFTLAFYLWLSFLKRKFLSTVSIGIGGETNPPCFYCPFKPVPLNHCKCQCMEYRPKITNKCLMNLHWQLKPFTSSLCSFYYYWIICCSTNICS